MSVPGLNDRKDFVEVEEVNSPYLEAFSSVKQYLDGAGRGASLKLMRTCL